MTIRPLATPPSRDVAGRRFDRRRRTGSPPLWQFPSEHTAVTMRPAGRLLANDARALIEAALTGTGIVMLADMLVADHPASGRLIRMVLDYTGPSRPMRLLIAAGHTHDPKLRAFIDRACQTCGGRADRQRS